jgi:hypothetical protein
MQSSLPERPANRFAVPAEELESTHLTREQLVQEVGNPHRLPLPDSALVCGGGGGGMDGDGD